MSSSNGHASVIDRWASFGPDVQNLRQVARPGHPMILLVGAFLAGMLTILSPCALPIVPLLVGASVAGRGRRIAWILIGFGVTFIAITVVLASALAAVELSAAGARLIAAVILAVAGLSLVVPALRATSAVRLAPVADAASRFARPSRPSEPLQGLVLGGLIGLVWAPCVGPIMAAVVVSSALVGPTVSGLGIASAYVVGAALTFGTVALLGQRVVSRVTPARRHALQRSAGLTMVLAAALIATGLDLTVQARIADALPAGWGTALTSVEDSPDVDAALAALDPTGAAAAVGREASVPLEDLGPAPELTGITDWINSEPLSLASLRGNVVLVHFWTFGCINCIHVQPYVKAWSDHYGPEGFVVVGVHTPELSFEREIANVRSAVADKGVRFPVAFDPDFATWRAYGNRYWPAFYFVDRAGRIRHVHYGEGDYDTSEAVIRALLAEPG